MEIRPVDLPAHVAENVTHFQSGAFVEMLQTHGESVLEHPLFPQGIAASGFASLIAKDLQATDLYYASAEMTALARSAGRSLPEIGLDEHDAPSRTGFIVFERGAGAVLTGEPPLECDVVACLWQEIEGRGLIIEHFTDRDHLLQQLVGAGVINSRIASMNRQRMPRVSMLGGSSTWMPYGADGYSEGAERFLEVHRTLRSAWLLMQQPVTVVADAEYRRADRRSLERRKIRPRPVRVITLRRASAGPSSGESDREYHHQWIVKGHWRQQWYPSRGVHRPVWIAPHIKGPEGAPLIGGEKVYAWTR